MSERNIKIFKKEIAKFGDIRYEFTPLGMVIEGFEGYFLFLYTDIRFNYSRMMLKLEVIMRG